MVVVLEVVAVEVTEGRFFSRFFRFSAVTFFQELV